MFDINVDKDTIEKIRRECPTIINLYKKYNGASFFFRGIKIQDMQQRGAGIIKKKIRTDRGSTYSKKDTAIIQTAYEELGIKAHRQNSIFVTSNAKIANHWGDLFFVFPADPFVFSYLKDNHAEYPLFTFTDAIWDARGGLRDDQKAIEAVKKVLIDDKVMTKNLDYPLLGQKEVLIHGTHYYAVRNRDIALRIINED